MRRIALIAAFAGTVLSGPALAQQVDQAAAQQACGNDVFAVCQQAIPDQTRIAGCLRQHFRQVSQPCQQFMASYAAQARRSAHIGRRGAQRETVGGAASE
jgi:hypothetical protein